MRRKQQSQNSLELFLDAICNMFGAFLFYFFLSSYFCKRRAANSPNRERNTFLITS